MTAAASCAPQAGTVSDPRTFGPFWPVRAGRASGRTAASRISVLFARNCGPSGKLGWLHSRRPTMTLPDERTRSPRARRQSAEDLVKTKRCGHCRRTKPLSAFSPDARRPDGHYPWCKACRYQYDQKNSVKPKPQGRPAMRPCLCCGQQWKTPGPGQRICPRCTKANAGVRETVVFRSAI